MAVFPINVFPQFNPTLNHLYRYGTGGAGHNSSCYSCEKTCCKKHPDHKNKKIKFDDFILDVLGCILVLAVILFFIAVISSVYLLLIS